MFELDFDGMLAVQALCDLIINMIGQAGVCGVLDKLLLAKGSAEEEPITLMERPWCIDSILFLRTAGSINLAADRRQPGGVICTHCSST
jgi:hypothetical protein